MRKEIEALLFLLFVVLALCSFSRANAEENELCLTILYSANNWGHIKPCPG